MRRRILSFMLTVFMICNLFAVSASARTLISGKHGTDFAGGELANRLESVFYHGINGCVSPGFPAVGGSFSTSQMYTTTFANQGGSKGDWTCQAYARAAYSFLFGYDLADGRYRVEFSDAKGRNTLNYDLFAGYGIRCGAYLRTTNLSDGSYSRDEVVIGHSMIILGYDSVGVTTLEGNYDNGGGIAICYFTWSQFNRERMNKRYVCSLSQPTKEIYERLGNGFVQMLPDFVCDVRIDCVNGQTVNLYNAPGAASRADYFNLGQSVRSTCGMVQNDGSTWYQITAKQKGVDKTFWLKYESWKMTVTNRMSEGPYTLTPKCAEALRLDVAGASANDGANVQIYTANGTNAQQWHFSYLNNGFFTLTSSVSGKALDVAGASPEVGANVQQYASNGSAAQQWMLKDAGDGYYYIVPKVNTALCLDVAGAGHADGTNVGLYTANGNDAQKWKLDVPSAFYTITFDPNGGSVDIGTKAIAAGTYLTGLPTPVRSGYTFLGWALDKIDSNGSTVQSTVVVSEGVFTFEKNTTLYALWSSNYKDAGGANKKTETVSSKLTISDLAVTVADGMIRASAMVTSNYDLTDFSFSNGVAGGGLGSVGKNTKTFKYDYEENYTNLDYSGAGIYTFWLNCTDRSGNSVTATYDYYLPAP